MALVDWIGKHKRRIGLLFQHKNMETFFTRFRIDMHGGHGNMASTKERQLRLYADVLAFFLSQTDGERKAQQPAKTF